MHPDRKEELLAGVGLGGGREPFDGLDGVTLHHAIGHVAPAGSGVAENGCRAFVNGPAVTIAWVDPHTHTCFGCFSLQ